MNFYRIGLVTGIRGNTVALYDMADRSLEADLLDQMVPKRYSDSLRWYRLLGNTPPHRPKIATLRRALGRYLTAVRGLKAMRSLYRLLQKFNDWQETETERHFATRLHWLISAPGGLRTLRRMLATAVRRYVDEEPMLELIATEIYRASSDWETLANMVFRLTINDDRRVLDRLPERYQLLAWSEHAVVEAIQNWGVTAGDHN